MRSHGLARILARHAADSLDVSVHSMPAGKIVVDQWLWSLRVPADTVLFLTKSAGLRIRQPVIDRLRAKGCRVLIDVVDHPIDYFLDLRDVGFVCASVAHHDIIRETGVLSDRQSLHIVLHNIDIEPGRFPRNPDRGRPLKMVYFGTPGLTHIPEAIRRNVEVLSAAATADYDRNVKLLGGFNAHYCMRGPGVRRPGVVKPFTKGFVAAALDAPPLLGRDTEDAAHFLGADYPFFCDATDDADIAKTYAAMEDACGGPVWHDALDRLASVRESASDATIAGQFVGAVAAVRAA